MKDNFEVAAYAFIQELEQFDYRIESIDHIWDMLVLDKKKKCHFIRVVQYKEKFFISLMDDSLCTLQVIPQKSVEAIESGFSSRDRGSHDPAKAWGSLIEDARRWLKVVQKDWIKANRSVHGLYPLNRRIGLAPHCLIRATITDMYRIDEALGKTKCKKFIKLVEGRYFSTDKNTVRQSMTANDYFEYCKIAYIAGAEKDEHVDKTWSGRKMYERYADGRDEGLLEIAPDSPEEFANWIDGKHPLKTLGGHPWEIKRGGNTTHIDLSVSRPSYYRNEGFTVCLRGASIGRLRETICMFLALQEAGFPITISDPEGIRKRLLAQDNIGIIPCFDSLHRANQHFHEHEDVYDVLHYDDLGRHKTRIKPFITWEPLPILKPKAISY